jgi:hypothetical protein
MDSIYGCFGRWIFDCGRNACEVGMGDSIPGWMCGTEGIGIITRDNFVCGFGNVGRSSAKE